MYIAKTGDMMSRSERLYEPNTITGLLLISLDDVQHFVLEDASWDLYEKLLRDIGRPTYSCYV